MGAFSFRHGLLLGVSLSLFALCACAAGVDIQVHCLPLASYTPAQEAELAVEIKALPQNSLLLRAMLDYEALRDADRACLAAGAKQ